MYVKLISHSTPSDHLGENGVDNLEDIVAFCARVSNPDNQFNLTTANKLIHYLIKHKHWSPLEMVSVCMEIGTTRDIARQILRHRSFSFQEFSQRYADPTKDLNFETREARLQDPKNRQNSVATDDLQLQEWWETVQKKVIDECTTAYNWAIAKGIAKDQARAVLPEGLIQSKLYMNGTLRSWCHYIQLRAATGTQMEHQEIAVACALELAKIFPMINSLVNEQ
jgi:thymidylate synthase (FAD)